MMVSLAWLMSWVVWRGRACVLANSGRMVKMEIVYDIVVWWCGVVFGWWVFGGDGVAWRSVDVKCMYCDVLGLLFVMKCIAAIGDDVDERRIGILRMDRKDGRADRQFVLAKKLAWR